MTARLDDRQPHRDGDMVGAGMKVIAVVQARAGSKRLPGKVLRLLGGRPVLEWVVRAARASGSLDDVVVATSSAPGDDRVAELAERLGAPVVRGSEEDVLARHVLALDSYPADAIVRLTADCPLLDPALVRAVVCAWASDRTLDYVATTLVRTLPRGLDVELIRAGALRSIDAEARAHHRTHVTSFLYSDPDRHRLLGLVVSPPSNDLRVTLDTPEDAALLDALVLLLGDRPPAWRDVVRVLRNNPALRAINEHVIQKGLEEG